ncbi:beta strand repeat-containing protein [Massilia scottii]|uniref:beta strand repeat-containing protein n=1 Tax=Massilia scottii TaxID=3057166 RepID=UPI002796D656|nr:VCBS domain-containing protein [Massilia sp. CCM 9029]MDQ1835388.1 VCBS domain-containing protein [Massilia sp. CCM 9029]
MRKVTSTDGTNTLIGGTSNEKVLGGSGNDVLDGGGGNDIVNGYAGDDTLIYNLTANTTPAAKDLYIGGSGRDTIVLQFTMAQWLSPSTQTQVAAYRNHLKAVTNSRTNEVGNGSANDFVFKFGASSLTVQSIEMLKVFVDGVEQGPGNQEVKAVADSASAVEDGPGIKIDVLQNDTIPGTLKTLSIASNPAHGSATVMQPDLNNPSTWYVQYQANAADFQRLGSGETATDTFSYTVTNADGSSSSATASITITGTNDVVIITGTTQAGALMQNAASNIATGTISFSDVDLSDGHVATFAAGANATALGAFALAPVSEAANAAAGSVGWTYTLDNAAARYLAAGQVASETYAVTIDDAHGSATTQNVVITITGANDAVGITSAAQAGATAEDAASNVASGTVSFDDADLADSHLATFSAGANATALGTFALASVSEAANAAAGSVDWTYTLNNAAAQYLSAGELVSETYTVTIDDAHGSATTQDVAISITGTNDNVSITSATQAGAVDAADSVATGTVSFTDIDLADSHVATFAASVNATALGTFALAPVSETANAAAGSVGWTYTLNDTAAQSMSAGQIVSETYTITIDDAHGSTITQDVVITITGTNHAVSITSAEQAGATLEDAPGSIATGTISFTDTDATDHHVASFAAGANATALGTFALAAVSQAGPGGSVGWTYTLNNAAAQYLAAGQVASETYTVTIDDAHGSTSTQDVVITITGSNDAVSITSAAQAGTMEEDTASSIASGTVSFNDVDLTDSHVATFAANANATALGTFTLAAVSEADSAGSVGWTYTLNNAAAQYLAAGQSVSETYTVTIDDAHGSTSSQDVVITITGSNDALSITSAAQTGALAEDAADSIAMGMIHFMDADLTDSHIATFAANANATALGTFTLAAVSAADSAGSVGWTYTLNNAAAQYLAAGQAISETYTVTMDDAHGSTSTQDVVITISGSNDAVSITSVAQVGAVVEDAASGTATGTMSFADVDLDDHHVATFAAGVNTTALGSFALAAVSEAASAGSVDWTYTMDNAAAQYLAAGQSVSETYAVTMDDAHGSTSTQDIVITISGSNDAVSVTSAAQTGALLQDAASNIATGNVSFTDIDLTDSHNATFAPGPNATALGSFALATVNEAANAAAGSVDWTYTLNNAAARYLAAGQTASEIYTVTIDDAHGSATTQDIVMTITGINDAPTGAATATLAPGSQNTAYTIGETTLLQGFSDVDDATVLHVANLSASHGTVADNGNGTFTITPTADYSGLVLLSYTVIDGSGGSIAGTGSFSIAASNRAPTGTATAVLDAGREDVVYIVSASSLLAGFSDPDGDPLAISGLSVTNGSVVNNGDGTFTITPALHYNGLLGLNYSVTDGHGGTVAATQSINLAKVNDAPAGTDKTVTLVEDKAYTFKTGDVGFTDDNDTPANALLAVKITALPATNAGTLLLNNAVLTAGALVSASDIAAGKLTFVPADNYNNSAATAASLTFQVQDDGGTLNGGINLDATPNTLKLIVAADNSDLGSGSPGTYTLSVNNGNVSILDASGGKSVDQVTGTSSFSTFNFERFSDNLEFTGISGTAGSVHLTILNQYFAGGGNTIDQVTLTKGGTVAGYALGTSSYNLFTSLTGTSSNDIIAGSSADDTISGNAGNDLLFGGAGNDRLTGGAGRDLLVGGQGADRFYFNAALSASSNIDTLVDFAAGTDVIELSASIFAAATSTGGVLDASNFRAIAGGSAQTSNQRILFDTTTGNLFYDADGSGSGARVQFAQISLIGMSETLNHTDFKMV